LPGALAIRREETEVAAFHHKAHTARGRIIVVILEDVAQRRDRLLVAVSIAVAQDARVRAIGIDAAREAAGINVAIVARLACTNRT
jgi:hypothetical protein